MRKVLLSILILTGLASNGQKVISLKLEGLKRTNENYIRLFIETKNGDDYDSAKVERDRQRVANLEIMGEVNLRKSISGQGVDLTLVCKEMINVIPILSFGSTKDNYWVRVGIQNANVTGFGHKLIAYYQNYDAHSFFLDYQTSRLKKRPMGMSGTFIRWSTIEPFKASNGSVVNYDYDNLNLGMAVTRYLGFKRSLELGLYGFRELYKQKGDYINPFASASLMREGALVKSIFRYNNLNYSSFSLAGFSFKINAELIKRRMEAGVFFIAFSDIKYFNKIGKNGNLGTRFRLGLSTNETTAFAPFVLDNFVNIRGVGNRVDRGTGSAVFNIEYRHTVINYKQFATQVVSFVDFGTWRKPGGGLSDFAQSNNMQAFSGLGCRFIYRRAFDTMLRLDYGIDYNKNGGLVLGIGQYF